MNMLQKVILLAAILWVCPKHEIHAQRLALKTNTLYWLGGGNVNGGFEAATGGKTTLQLSVSYNPWTFKADKKMRFWLVEPEVKFWLCEPFEGHFFGIHAHGSQFYGGFRGTMRDGYMAGVGVTYGYNWILSPHWNLEAEVGLGYEYLWYKQTPNQACIKCWKDAHAHYVGPTKASLAFVYVF